MGLVNEVITVVVTKTLGDYTCLKRRLQWFGHILSEQLIYQGTSKL